MSPNWPLRVSLGRTWDPRLVCAVTLSLVFLCGAAAGAVAMNFEGVHNWLHRPPFDSPAGKALYFAHVKKELNLTPAQTEQVQTILNDFWQYYRTVLSDSKARVEQVLNDEQKQKFERLLQERK